MTFGDNESVRAVLLTPSWSVLLMKVAGRLGELWITPGGRVRTGEDAHVALARELHEETGYRDIRVQAEIWVRHGTYVDDNQRLEERERFFLIRAPEFTPSHARMEPAERRRFRGFRWWSIQDIASSTAVFVPRRLGELLIDLQRTGAPSRPIETGG